MCVVGAKFVKFELFVRVCLNCVLGPPGSEWKPLMFTMLRFLRWRLFSQKFYQKLRHNVIFLVDVSGSFGLFVGQCVASLETSVMSSSRTPLSQSDVKRPSLVYSCEVFARNESGKCQRTHAHCQDPFSHFGCSSDFTSLSCFWRVAASSCLFVQLHASTASSSDTFCGELRDEIVIGSSLCDVI